MRGLGAMMNGGKGNREKPDNQWYPTPPECTVALMQAESFALSALGIKTIWEPACGDGAMAEIIEHYGYDVIGTDLIDRGYGQGGRDFLHEQKPLARGIITNPPYDELAEAFIRHAFHLGVEYVAMLLKSNYFHVSGRARLYFENPPIQEYKLTWRPDFMGYGNPTMTCTWFVWRKPCLTETTRHTNLLMRPDLSKLNQLNLLEAT